jgi:dipeptidyl aminopeptidase/acylaminoacyl peptidase
LIISNFNLGPHACSLLNFNKTITFWTSLGFKVCLINYRGSLNISDDYVKQLCGNVGDIDVSLINYI